MSIEIYLPQNANIIDKHPDFEVIQNEDSVILKHLSTQKKYLVKRDIIWNLGCGFDLQVSVPETVYKNGTFDIVATIKKSVQKLPKI